MATKWNFFNQFFKNLLLWNHWSDLLQKCSLGDLVLKNCLQNIDLSINMALVSGDYLHYTDMKKFSKLFFSETSGQLLKDSHRNVLRVTFFKSFQRNSNQSIKMALMNGGYYTNMWKFLKSLFL